MAIRVVGGVPGSGKTFWIVYWIMTRYFQYNKKLFEWIPRADDVRVIHNVDSLKIGESLEDHVKAAGSTEQFFNKDYQEQNIKGRVVYVIDEAQRWFPTGWKDTESAFYFQYHRHLGHDIFLVVPDEDSLSRLLRSLAEYHIRAVRRTLSLMGEFRYKFCDDPRKIDLAWKTTTLKRDKRIFALYRSMVQEETEKHFSAPRRYLIWLAILFLIGFAAFKLMVSSLSWGHGSSTPVASSIGPSSNVPLVPVAASVKPSLDSPLSFSLVGLFSGSPQVFVIGGPGGQMDFDSLDLAKNCRCHVEDLVVGDSVPWFGSTFGLVGFPGGGAANGREGESKRASGPGGSKSDLKGFGVPGSEWDNFASSRPESLGGRGGGQPLVSVDQRSLVPSVRPPPPAPPSVPIKPGPPAAAGQALPVKR